MFILLRLRFLIEREIRKGGVKMPVTTMNFWISEAKYPLYLEKKDVVRAKIKAFLIEEGLFIPKDKPKSKVKR